MSNVKNMFIFAIFVVLATRGYGQEAELCQSGKEKAERLISSGTILFPRLGIESTTTFRKLLEIEYGIQDAIPDNEGCVSFESEEQCLYQVMLTTIEKKFGLDFLTNQRRIADKLDKEGQGYVRASELVILDSLRRYVKRNAPERNPNMGYLIELKISADKKLTDVEVLHGLFNAKPIERNSSDYLFVRKALAETQLTFEADKFKGKPIDSIISFYLTF